MQAYGKLLLKEANDQMRMILGEEELIKNQELELVARLEALVAEEAASAASGDSTPEVEHDNDAEHDGSPLAASGGASLSPPSDSPAKASKKIVAPPPPSGPPPPDGEVSFVCWSVLDRRHRHHRHRHHESVLACKSLTEITVGDSRRRQEEIQAREGPRSQTKQHQRRQ